MALRKSLAGHVWTVAPHLADVLRPNQGPSSTPWSCDVPSPWETIMLRGAIHRVSLSSPLAIVVHGLGGDMDSPYVRRMARTCVAHGISCLRVNLRGADGHGEDLYHAGLVDDLLAVVDHPSLREHRDILVVGYSLGGHLALHVGRVGHPRVRAVAAICAPLDLEASCAAIDRPSAFLYRRHVLRGLKQSYRAFADRRPVLTPIREVDAVASIRDWDRLVVVPRHGFDSVEHYHASQSIAPHLDKLAIPTLYVGARFDPMVVHGSVAAALREAGPNVEVILEDWGGHVGFPRGRQGTVEERVLQWASQYLSKPGESRVGPGAA